MSTAATFTRDGLSLALHDGGGSGAPFVFQHGLCGSAAQTAEVVPELARIRSLTLESRGHGASDAGDPAQFSIATFTDDVAALITERGLVPAIVGGISMGAARPSRASAPRWFDRVSAEKGLAYLGPVGGVAMPILPGSS